MDRGCVYLFGKREGLKEMVKFTLEYWQDGEWFVGRAKEVPGVFSQGQSLEELKENIQDAYRLMIESEPLDAIPYKPSRVSVEMTA